jgi:hypothetical protein
MLEEAEKTGGACWICNGRTERTGTQRLGRTIPSDEVWISRRALVDEYLCRDCGAVEWLETNARVSAPAGALGEPPRRSADISV